MKTTTQAIQINTDTWQDDFSTWLASEGRSERTIAAYLADLGLFCRWFEQANGETFEPALINSTDIKLYHRWSMEVAGNKPATWNRHRSALNVLCAWIVETQGRAALPFNLKQIPIEKEQRHAPRWLSAKEKAALLRQVEIEVAAANTDKRRSRAVRDAAMIMLMVFSALRISEVVALAIGDVQLSERKGLATLRHAKGAKTRQVPISSTARDWLKRWLELRQGTAKDVLFSDENGQAISERAVQKRVQALAQQLGIEKLEPHALRHTCLKSLLDAGRPLTEVQQIAGHERIATTALYLQPGEEDLQDAVEAGELGKMARRGGK